MGSSYPVCNAWFIQEYRQVNEVIPSVFEQSDVSIIWCLMLAVFSQRRVAMHRWTHLTQRFYHVAHFLIWISEKVISWDLNDWRRFNSRNMIFHLVFARLHTRKWENRILSTKIPWNAICFFLPILPPNPSRHFTLTILFSTLLKENRSSIYRDVVT